MTENATIELPALGAEGEPCGSCGAPLASDQRYCLNCGARRGAPRVDLESEFARASATTSNGKQPVTAEQQRVWTPFAIVGSLALLGTMLLLGVLIGKDEPAEVAATNPQPVVVETTGGEERATASTPAGENGDAAKGGADGKDEGGDKSEEVEGDPAVTDQIEALEEVDPDDYSKESAKLPDEVAIPGKPPPADNKAPGGGGPAVTIGG